MMQADALKNSLEVFQKVKHRITIRRRNSSSRYILKRNETICPHKNMYTNVYNSITHNIQK